MSLDWKLQRRLHSRPHNLMRFLAISLLLHGAAFLGLEIHRHQVADQPLQTEANQLKPVEFVEVPADRVPVTPPNNAKQKASTNSRAGGKARPELPLVTRAPEAKPTIPLPSSRSSLTQARSSPPQSRQQVPPEQPRSAPNRAPQPPTDDDRPKTKPIVAQALPKPKSSSRQSQRQEASGLENPANLDSHESTSERRNYQPHTKRVAQNGNSNNNPFIPGTLPNLKYSSRQSQRQTASALGGPVKLASREFMSDRGDYLPNTNRSTPDSYGVDARKDINLAPYLDLIRQQVKQQWHPQVVTHSSAQTVIGFSVTRSGQVNELQILQSSGSTFTDQAALTAIRQAAPFGPLPMGYRGSQLNILFRFNINVYGQLEPRS